MSAPLFGLLLAGGHSRRMHTDKAQLRYEGRPQLERAHELLAPMVQRCFVSVRPDQRDDALRSRYDCIADRLQDFGPLAGIHAALHAHRTAAWLVLACDLPLLNAGTLQKLIAARAPGRIATAFRSSHDGKPEPLCAIWEPRALEAVEAWIVAGKQCPRALLAASDVELLDLNQKSALDNINTPEEFAEARTRLAPPAAGDAGASREPIEIEVRYFALLRDQAGRSRETVRSSAPTPQALYAELRQRHSLSLPRESLRVAVNDEFAEWERALAAGDRVAFLPPVAGG